MTASSGARSAAKFDSHTGDYRRAPFSRVHCAREPRPIRDGGRARRQEALVLRLLPPRRARERERRQVTIKGYVRIPGGKSGLSYLLLRP